MRYKNCSMKRFSKLFLLFLTAIPCSAAAKEAPSHPGYQLEQMVVFSRHNIRSPLSEKGSALDQMTTHEWINWSSDVGELSLRGGTLETAFGQYFRKYLTEQGLMEENWIPDKGEVRFYANSLQRTIATARYFSAGMLPLANIDVEQHMTLGTMDPTFDPVLSNASGEFLKLIDQEIDQLSDGGLQGYIDSMSENVKTLESVLDFSSSEYAKKNGITSIPLDDVTVSFQDGKIPSMNGGLRLAAAAADALILQYYEQGDDLETLFDREITEEELTSIADIYCTYQTILFGTPSAAANMAHPLLQEIRQELTIPNRKFTFLCGHDSNVETLLCALQLLSEPLENTICLSTPIGIKIVFERWSDKEEHEFLTASLVYQTTEQLRSNALLDLNSSPEWMPLTFDGLEANEDGMYPLDRILDRLDERIALY